jgi:helix-turn-helix domain of resolvase
MRNSKIRKKTKRPKLNEEDILCLSRLLGVKNDEEFVIFPSKYRPLKTTLRKINHVYTYDKDVYLLLGSLKDDMKFSKDKFGNNVLDTKTNNIKYVPAIMIDIDSHRFGLNRQKAEIIKDTLVYRLESDYKTNIVPDEISYTGRGLQLFYNVNEYAKGKKNILSLAKDFRSLIVGEIEKILEDFNKFFMETGQRVELEIDNSTSMKRQLFRCPGFVNTKSGQEAHFIFHQERERRIVMGPAIKELKEELGIKPTGKKFVKFKKDRKFNSVRELHDKREEDTIAHLLRYGKGVRHKCYINLITIKLNRGDNENDIVKSLLTLDSKIDEPYFKDKAEVEANIQNVKEYWKVNFDGEIRVSNENMQDFLGISDEDLAKYSWRTFGQSRSVNKSAGINKYDRVMELFRNGVCVSQIAKEVCCSRTTVYKYVGMHELKVKELRAILLASMFDNKELFSKELALVKGPLYIDNLNRAKLNTFKKDTHKTYKKIE